MWRVDYDTQFSKIGPSWVLIYFVYLTSTIDEKKLLYLNVSKHLIQIKWSEQAKRAHSILREVEKMV